MKLMIQLMSLGLVLSLATPAMAVEDAYFQIKKVSVRDVTEKYEGTAVMATPVMANCAAVNANGELLSPMAAPVKGADAELNPLTQLDIYLDQIINLGRKVWNIIEAGRPVVNVKMDVANALPRGLSCWNELSGWQIPQSKVYEVVYENGFGAEVVTFAYRVTFTAGGGMNGKGKYVTNATFMPASLNVSWGFTFNATAEIPSVFNMGTTDNPVAGMQMVMKWSVDTPVTHIEESETFFVSGDNKLVHLE